MTDSERLIAYAKRRYGASNVLVVETPVRARAGQSFDFVFVPAGDPMIWIERVKEGGVLAGSGPLPDALPDAARQGDVWVAYLGGPK